MPKVSVLLTSFNHEKYIREAIDSVLVQTFTDFELIIWDDASSDDSWYIINSYSDPRIKAFRNDESRRGIYGLNKAISEIVAGEYIAIHHSDDVWEPEKLEKQIEFLDGHPEFGAVFTNALAIGEDDDPLTDRGHFYSNIFDQPNRPRHQWLNHFFYRGNALCHPSVLIRKHCYEDCGLYRYGLAQLGDFDMWMRLCLKYEIHVLPEKLVHFRVRANEANTSGNRPEIRIRHMTEYYYLLRNFLRIETFEEMVAIFPEAKKYYRTQGFEQQFVLAMIALRDNTLHGAKFFGIELLFDLLGDVIKASKIKSLYGFDYRDLIVLTAKYDVFSLEHVASLNQAVTERDGQIANLNQTVAERDGQIASLNQTVQGKDTRIDHLGSVISELESQTASLNQIVAERDGEIARLNQTVVERDGQIASLNQIVAERDGEIARLNQTVVERDGQIAGLNQVVAERDGQIASLNQAVAEIHESTCWRLTTPVRFVGRQLLRIKIIFKALPYARIMCGGYHGLLKHVWRGYKDEGMNGIKRRIVFSASPGAPPPVIDYAEPDRNDYSEWVRRYDTLTDSDRKKIKARINRLPNMPLISIVIPVYNPPLGMLKEAIQSVQNQLYPNWELCIADDASTDKSVRELLNVCADKDTRIKIVFRDRNGHISAASNSALELASGEFIALLDNDDLLPEHALFWVVQAIADHPDVGLIYSDEDKIDQSGRRYAPYFKADWNPDLFLSHNMICHLGVYRADLVKKLGGFREGYEGAQDYDLALRCSEQLTPHQIVHIPRVLYHWRSHPGSTAQAGSEKSYALLAGERALNDHFARVSVSAKAELLEFGMYRARYDSPTPAPLVSLIIPTRNGLHLIKQCVESILAKTTYKNYEILIIDNNSDDPQTLEHFASLVSNSRIRVLRDERPFNYSALNNAAVMHARGEYLGLINNDIEVIAPQWLDEMVSLAAQSGVGAVGARLWYPNDTLQHGGCITGVGGVAGHSHKHLPKGHFGYFARAQLIQTLSVVTAACLVIKKNIYQEVGGLDEINLKVAFNDVDFCLRVREAGYRNVWTPYAELYHHESATRGYEDTPEKQLRFRDELLCIQKRWGETLLNDPAYSPNLTLDREDFSFAWPPRVEPLAG
jgi:glycosyltransferase involved in cell wall biosynthesis